MSDNTDKVKAVLGQEEEILAAGFAKALAIFNKEPTKANTENVTAARKMLEDYRASKQEARPAVFAKKRDVINYLIADGWDVKPDSSKVYNDLDGIPRKAGYGGKKRLTSMRDGA